MGTSGCRVSPYARTSKKNYSNIIQESANKHIYVHVGSTHTIHACIFNVSVICKYSISYTGVLYMYEHNDKLNCEAINDLVQMGFAENKTHM